jgi:hypothetical protein
MLQVPNCLQADARKLQFAEMSLIDCVAALESISFSRIGHPFFIYSRALEERRLCIFRYSFVITDFRYFLFSINMIGDDLYG